MLCWLCLKVKKAFMICNCVQWWQFFTINRVFAKIPIVEPLQMVASKNMKIIPYMNLNLSTTKVCSLSSHILKKISNSHVNTCIGWASFKFWFGSNLQLKSIIYCIIDQPSTTGSWWSVLNYKFFGLIYYYLLLQITSTWDWWDNLCLIIQLQSMPVIARGNNSCSNFSVQEFWCLFWSQYLTWAF